MCTLQLEVHPVVKLLKRGQNFAVSQKQNNPGKGARHENTCTQFNLGYDHDGSLNGALGTRVFVCGEDESESLSIKQLLSNVKLLHFKTLYFLGKDGHTLHNVQEEDGLYLTFWVVLLLQSDGVVYLVLLEFLYQFSYIFQSHECASRQADGRSVRTSHGKKRFIYVFPIVHGAVDFLYSTGRR